MQRRCNPVFVDIYQRVRPFQVEFNLGLGKGESKVPIDAARSRIVVRCHQRSMADPVPAEHRQQSLADASRETTAALVRPG